jgi:hypothetical protein
MALFASSYSVMLLENNDRRKIIPLVSDCFEFTDEREYIIALYNHNTKLRIDATIEIDGKLVGNFRVNESSSILIERPSDNLKSRKLVFCNENSHVGRAGGLSEDNILQGTIVVTISEEKLQPRGETVSDSPDGFTRGGTVLGAPSRQTFSSCASIQHTQTKFVLFARMGMKRFIPKDVPQAIIAL